MTKIFSLMLLLLSISLSAFASGTPDFNFEFKEGLNSGNSHLKEPHNTAKRQFSDPKQTFEKYNPNPEQQKYFKGDTQTSTNMAQDAAAHFRENEAGSAAYKSFLERPDFKINTNSQEMQRPILIANDANNIAHGISDQYIDCTKTKSCETTYSKFTCTEDAGRHKNTKTATCTKDLNVYVTPPPIFDQTATIKIGTHKDKGPPPTITVDLITGQITASQHAINPTAVVSPQLHDVLCNNLQVQYLGLSHKSDKVGKLNILSIPSCSNHFQVTAQIVFNRGDYQYGDVQFAFHFTAKGDPSFSDNWNDHCLSFASNPLCKLQNEVCSQGQATHIIDGYPVTRPCWQLQDTYACKIYPSPNNCEPFRKQGCEQVASSCHEGDIFDGACLVYDQTFRCPIKHCSEDIGIACGGDTFCLSGDCTVHEHVLDQDFARGLSALSAIAAASKDFNSDLNAMFTGYVEKCSDDALSFCDCCTDSGWGKDIHLESCSDEEKKLGKDKENKLTLKVGRYCAKETLGVCIEHKTSYCVFNSKLARLIQEQGRVKQLNISLGSGEHPNCRGISPEELQRIDFSKIDFSEFFEDLKAKQKLPDESKVNQRISERVKDMHDKEKPHVGAGIVPARAWTS